MKSARAVLLALLVPLAPAFAQESQERAVDYYIRQGDEQAEARQYPAAVQLYGQAIDAWAAQDGFKKRALANFKRARAYALSGSYKQALDDLKISAELDPKNPDAFLLRATIHFRRKASSKAAADAQQALKLRKGLVEAMVVEAAAKDRLKDYKGAVAAATAALKREPQNSSALIVRGAARYHAGDAKRAIADLDHALELDPKNPRGYYWRALAFRKRGMKGSAKIDQDNLTKLRPDFGEQIKKLGAPFLYPLPFAD